VSRDDPSAVDRARVAELELELAAARRTIGVLLDRLDRQGDGAPPAGDAGPGDRLGEPGPPGPEGRSLASDLDSLVRQRTRALAESEAQLRVKNAELQRQSERRAEFIAVIAHELRTPLTSIVGYLDLLGEGRFGELTDEVRRPVGSLQRNAHRLRRLADEMLDAARLEARGVTLDRRPTDLAELAGEVVTELGPLAQSRGVEVAVTAGPLRALSADPDKLHQVIANLVLNAIRHASDGAMVAVCVDEVPATEFPGEWVRIRVRHDGPGIPTAAWERMFEPFAQLEPAKHHSSGPASAGLGLYIARSLVELHGGLITVESADQRSAEFTVLLPRVAA
jgi:signal transduction histidine kinase